MQFVGVQTELGCTKSLDQVREAALTVSARCQLGSDVSQNFCGLTRIFFDQAKNGLIWLSCLVQLQGGYAQALLVHLGGIYRHAPGRDTAHISLMGQSRNVALNSIAYEDRLDDIKIRQVHAARAIGVVEYEDVTLDHIAAVLTNEATHGLRKGAQMYRGREPLRNDAT